MATEATVDVAERVQEMVAKISHLEPHYKYLKMDLKEALTRNPAMDEEAVEKLIKRRRDIYQKMVDDNETIDPPLPGMSEMFRGEAVNG